MCEVVSLVGRKLVQPPDGAPAVSGVLDNMTQHFNGKQKKQETLHIHVPQVPPIGSRAFELLSTRVYNLCHDTVERP